MIDKNYIFNPENCNILIVDDSRSTNIIIKKVFEKEHYTCYCAFTIKEAKEIINKQKIDYIILDINLPDGNGFEIIKLLEKSKIKIFVLTSENDKQFRHIAYKKGIVDFIEKKGNFLYKIKQLPSSVKKVEANKLKTILVVDDSIFIQQQLRLLLENRNYNVELADDADIAWEIISNKSIDLMLLDLNLKHSYGLDFLTQRRIDIIDKRKIPVMIVSGNINPAIVRDGLKAGAVDILTKPYVAEEIMLKVDLWIDYKRKEDDILKSHQLLEQYKLAVDRSTIVSKTDPQGIITYVNDQFCKISGYTKEEILNKNHNIVKDPNTDPKIFEEMWHTIKDLKKSWSGELKNISKNGTPYWVNAVINPILNTDGDITEYIAIRNDITKQKKIELKIREAHKKTRDSIKYASLIQGALIPRKEILGSYFKDYFVYWKPKDTVGGDIWLFENLRHKDECLFMFIDCTGHGVPGAFVTMIIKAIEREVISIINSDINMDVSPAWIMGYFNKTMKALLRQETNDSISNAGFDGGIIYYNRRTQILKFAGAETPLFYITNDGELNTIKGNRYSVGYKQCDSSYQYKETLLEVKKGMKFYCTTDGYLDQNGGSKDFPFGKKRFKKIILANYTKPMQQQQNIFLNEIEKYEAVMEENHDRNDDITVIGFEIDEKSAVQEDIIEEILKYEGVMTQNVIASCMDNIEAKITHMGMIGTISTITIEYCQNIMNYSKGLREEDDNNKIVPAGIVEVQYINNEYYKIIATNIINTDDKEIIESKLIEIQSLDKTEIKKRYRELRRSGKNTHKKGGGIGIYEIAKVSDSIKYEFTAVKKDKYTFSMSSIVKIKKRARKEN